MNTEATAPILVGMDGSRFSRAALRWAASEAGYRNCPVHVLRAWHPAPVAVAGRPDAIGLAGAVNREPDADSVARLESSVAEVLGTLSERRVSTELRRGGPAEELVAASEHAQLLVLGSHGHGFVTEALLGSVARYCVRHASCPVVVLPAAFCEAETPN